MTKDAQFHENFDRSERVKSSSDRVFGLVFFVFFAVITLWPVLFGNPVRWWTAPFAGIFLALALLAPRVLAPLNRLWTGFGLLLHRVVNPLVMGLLFFVAITPMGLAVRLLGKDLLRLKRDPAAASYWIERNPPGPPADSMRRQF
ncbi:MAG: SxtJ family membrane protein [Reyranellaceae bacterium]